MELTITGIIENAAELERDAQQDSQLQAATSGLADTDIFTFILQ